MGLSKPMEPLELESVRPTLLLPPTEKGGIASELAGGAFDLGDRVACLKSTGELHAAPKLQGSFMLIEGFKMAVCWLSAVFTIALYGSRVCR